MTKRFANSEKPVSKITPIENIPQKNKIDGEIFPNIPENNNEPRIPNAHNAYS